MLTRVLVWVGLALFIYFLLTRLRTLAILAGTWRGLGEDAAVRIRFSRIAVESVVTGGTIALWATRAINNGHLDWSLGGSESPVHLELSGVWFIVGSIGVVTAVALMLGFTVIVALARAEDLRARFPRSAKGRPEVLRLAVMNPVMVFVAHRSPLAWVSTEAWAAAWGVVSTLAMEGVGDELPRARSPLSDTVDDASELFELEKRWARRGRILRLSELPAYLGTVTGVAPVEPDPLILPPADAPIGARAAGFWVGAFVAARKSRQAARRSATLATFDERGTLATILADTPGPLARVYLTEGLDGLLHEVRGAVLYELKPRLPGRQRRRLAKAYKSAGMEGAAAWMIENIASYPELFEQAVDTELSAHARVVDSIVARIQSPPGE